MRPLNRKPGGSQRSSDRNADHTGFHHAERTRRTDRHIDDPAPDEWSAIIDAALHRTTGVRHGDDAGRRTALEQILVEAQRAADRRGVEFAWRQTMDQQAVPMDKDLTEMLERAVRCADEQPVRMMSGAGHDAMIVAARLPTCMLFLRSPGGLSHHPDESVLAEDVEAALTAGMEFLKLLSEQQSAT